MFLSILVDVLNLFPNSALTPLLSLPDDVLNGGIRKLFMNTIAMKNLILSSLSSYGTQLVIILTAIIGIGLAYLVFRMGWRLVQGTTWQSNAWLDRMTYKPYKGYNRFRSRSWNVQHTIN